MNELLQFIIAVIALAFLYFAFVNKNEITKLFSYIILGAILIQSILSSLASAMIFDFLSNTINGIGSLVPYVEVGLIIFLAFFYMPNKVDKLMRTLVIIFTVSVLLIEFGAFK